jgi:hypothetical protein
MAAVTALIFSMLVGPRIIAYCINTVGEEIRTDVQNRIRQKRHTDNGWPDYYVSILIAVLLWADPLISMLRSSRQHCLRIVGF